MRPSKLRLPDSTGTTTRSCSETACGERVGQRAGVADAGRAAVADEVEAQRVECLREAGALQVLGDHPRAGREAGLDPRLRLQAALDGLARQQPGGDHHGGVRGVGARRDRGDHHGAVIDLHVGFEHGRRGGRVGRNQRAAGQAHRVRITREGIAEAGRGGGQRDAVLRPARAREARLALSRSSSSSSVKAG